MSKVFLSKALGTLFILWTCLFSKFYSLLNPGPPLGLLLFIAPLLITQWCVQRAGLTNPDRKFWPFPLMPFAGCLSATLISSSINDQSLLHPMGPGLWIWGCTVILTCSQWQQSFLKSICKISFWIYLAYAALHLLPEFQTPTHIWSGLLKENVNILNIHLATLAAIAYFDESKNAQILLALLIFFFFVWLDSIAGLGAGVLSILLLSSYRRYAIFGIAILTAIISAEKLLLTADSFSVRAEIMTQGISQGLESVFFGIGYGKPIIVSLRNGLELNHPHCTLINCFRTTGLIGLGAYLYLLYTIYLYRVRIPRAFQAVLLLYIIWGLIDDFMVWYGTMLFFAFAVVSATAPEEHSPGSVNATVS